MRSAASPVYWPTPRMLMTTTMSLRDPNHSFSGRTRGLASPIVFSRDATATDDPQQLPPFAVRRVSRDYLVHHRLCPAGITDTGELSVLVAPDADREALEELEVLFQARVVTVDATWGDVQRAIEHLTDHGHTQLGNVVPDISPATDVRELANQPPVVRYLNLLIREASDARASDIHLEANNDGLNARFRIDGALVQAPGPPPDLSDAVISRIKLLADMNIAERRRPQDGRIRVRMDAAELDLRVSTVPTMFGESTVLRLLDQGGRPAELESLGIPAHLLAQCERLFKTPHGMVLVTGPTGSGKTTTLYAALRRQDVHGTKVVSVEDPIEYQLDGVTQIPVQHQSGMTFAAALRSVLRQDPDVIMVGEMRDQETAAIATQAALTGHRVFSTLHANDSIAAVPRLLDLGIPPYLVGATVEGVIAQRLVRANCVHCVGEYKPEPDVLTTFRDMDVPKPCTFRKGTGCKQCRGTGYFGRIGIFEILVIDESIRRVVSTDPDRDSLRAIAQRTGWRSLHENGWARACAGDTTVEEVLRVLSA